MAITYDSKTKTFYLDGKNYTYAFRINAVGYAQHCYFGARIAHDPLFFVEYRGFGNADATPAGIDTTVAPYHSECYNITATECSFYGTGDFREPSVLVQNDSGDRISDLLYEGYDILKEKPAIPRMPSMDGGETLVLHLGDRKSRFYADVYYTVYPDVNVLARHTVYRNEAKTPVKLLRAYSFDLSLPGQDYDCISLYGAWANERSPERTPIRHGVLSIDSKRTTSSGALNPFMAICEKSATEDFGEAYGVNLVYSSSYVLKAEGTASCNVKLTGGINDFDFTWKLDAGETFATPEAVIAYSNEGIGGMSRAFHDAYRDHLINKRFVKQPRPLLINNWEGTYFNFNNEKLMAIVDAVKGSGIDTFVLDDGWFGKRDNDRSGLGDWIVNGKKLAGGLKPLIDHVHGAGMKFGLWFEPEMISEDSDIFRAHPEYAIGVPGRGRCYSRHQFIMDITQQEVRNYIVDSVNKILHSNEIDYVKWDYNRNVTDRYAKDLPADRQMEFSHRYALGLYDLFDRIVEANPTVFFEGCSGGGARFDPGVLHYFPQIWTSDDSDAEERTKIQYGTSYVYPLSAMACHLSICPNHQTGRTTPFATRADVAHLGATGYELDTTKFTEDEKNAVTKQTAEYHEMESLVLTGDLYRIENPFEGNFFAEAVVAKDKSRAYLLCYKRMGGVNPPAHRVRMKGLDPKKNYYVPEMNLILSGASLMNVGLYPHFPQGDFVTVKYHFEEK